MGTRRILRICLSFLTCLLVVLAGEMAVHRYLGRATSTEGDKPVATPTVDELFAKVEQMRAERKDLEQQEQALRAKRRDLENQERQLLYEAGQRLAEQERKAKELTAKGRVASATAVTVTR